MEGRPVMSDALALGALHTCVYLDGFCVLSSTGHGGRPDPDPGDARVEDFEAVPERDGGLSLRCAHYARGCWWEQDVAWGTLEQLTEMAQEHLTDAHVRTVDGGSVDSPVALTGGVETHPDGQP